MLGASGSGKSSVVLAGLVPALQTDKSDRKVVELKPGNAPLAQWAQKVAPACDQPMLLIVDQFEEIFTLCTDDDQRRDFIRQMLDLVGPHQSHQVVITMRADFWGDCAPYPDLREAMQSHQELIPPLNAQELQRAMERQAAAGNLAFETGLSQIILDDVSSEPGAMPLLQHALQELWNCRHGRWLRSAEYHTIGRTQGSIARTADTMYAGLPPGEKNLMRDIFVRLTRLDSSAQIEMELRDTRQRVSQDSLVAADSTLAATRSLLNRLADARLVVINSNEVEVAHEALIRHWPKLREWLVETDRARAVPSLST